MATKYRTAPTLRCKEGDRKTRSGRGGVRRGMAGRGMPRLALARRVQARHGEARQGYGEVGR